LKLGTECQNAQILRDLVKTSNSIERLFIQSSAWIVYPDSSKYGTL